MNLTPHQKRQLGLVLVLLFGIPAVVFLVYKGVQFIANAGSDSTPQDVLISNITTNSLTVSWVTEKKTSGYVVPILNGVEQSPIQDSRSSFNKVSHYVVLDSLEPSTEYSFIILSDGKKFKNKEGVEYKFSTAPISDTTPIPNPVYGSITGSNLDDVILYVFFSDKSTYPVSTQVPTTGNWTLDLSSIRSVSDKSILQVTESTSLTVLARSGVDRGGVLEGAYSSLFDNKGKLLQSIQLEEVLGSSLLEYFPDIADLGTSQEIIVPEEPEEPEEPEQPVKPVVPVQPQAYTRRQDVQWEDLVASAGSIEMESGEDTVTVTNLTDTYAVISWRSSQKEEGYVKYGTSKTELTEEIVDSRDTYTEKGEYYSHYIESGRLQPDTTYYFEIYSGDDVYDYDGQKYTFKTFSTLSSSPPLETRVGEVVNSDDLSDLVLVGKIIDNDELGTVGSSGYVSVLPDTNGTWELVIGDVRSEDGSSYFSFSDADILQIYILGAIGNKYDFNLSLNEIELDVSKLGEVGGGKVDLLTDYGLLLN